MTSCIAVAYAAPAAKAPLERTTIERRSLREHDVLIEIAYVGVCHSDIHQVRGDWAPGTFPMVPGHEITGVVTEAGPGVRKYRVGDRVGVGCFIDSCRVCDQCRVGEVQYCRVGATQTYNDHDKKDGSPTYGGYSTHIVVDENYVLAIPEGLGLDVAAPLLCAGITTYSPLAHWKAGPATMVAIIGMTASGTSPSRSRTPSAPR